MSGGMPVDNKHAMRLLDELAEQLGLELCGGPPTPRHFELRGLIDGQSVSSSGSVKRSMGAVYYSAKTSLPLEPPLSLGLKLRLQQQAQGGAHHLPKRWRSSIDEGGYSLMYEMSSTDPSVTRDLLATVAPPFAAIAVDRLSDTALLTSGAVLGTRADFAAHLQGSARFARSLAAAGDGFEPDDHDALSATSWRAVARTHGGRLRLRHARFEAEWDGSGLTIEARCPNPVQRNPIYRLHGTLEWRTPLPLDDVSLSSRGGGWKIKRWLRGDLELGDDIFDRAFLVQSSSDAGGLGELLRPQLRAASLGLLAEVEELELDSSGARFVIHHLPSDVDDVEALVEAARVLCDAVRVAGHKRRGAYR